MAESYEMLTQLGGEFVAIEAAIGRATAEEEGAGVRCRYFPSKIQWAIIATYKGRVCALQYLSATRAIPTSMRWQGCAEFAGSSQTHVMLSARTDPTVILCQHLGHQQMIRTHSRYGVSRSDTEASGKEDRKVCRRRWPTEYGCQRCRTSSRLAGAELARVRHMAVWREPVLQCRPLACARLLTEYVQYCTVLRGTVLDSLRWKCWRTKRSAPRKKPAW